MLKRATRIMAVLLATLAFAFILDAQEAKTDTVLASYYGAESGALTASGDPYIPMGFTAAHPSLPFGTNLEVCLLDAGECVVVVVNDRGPAAWTGKDIDLSLGAALEIGLAPNLGVASVSVHVLE